MSYLVRLKAEFSGTRLPNEPPKPPKVPFVSSGSTSSGRIPASEAARCAGALFSFSPLTDPDSDREAIEEERAGIIAEGCGMDPAQALREARWQAEREKTWRVFICNAKRILEAPEAGRNGLLDRYHAEAARRYGEPTATHMDETMRRWIAAGHDIQSGT